MEFANEYRTIEYQLEISIAVVRSLSFSFLYLSISQLTEYSSILAFQSNEPNVTRDTDIFSALKNKN